MTTRVAVHGAAGRMGRAVLAVLAEEPGLRLTGAIESGAAASDAVASGAAPSGAAPSGAAPSGAAPSGALADEGHAAVGRDVSVLAGGDPRGLRVTASLEQGLEGADVVIDFTRPAAARALLAACARRGLAAVIGTTGLGPEEHALIDALARTSPVVVAPNMSVGVTVLSYLAARAAQLLGEGYDAELVEMHHRHKVDAPSGTAARLAEVVALAKGLDPAEAVVHGRSGQVGARPRAQVGVLALRGGDVVGDHTLVLAGPGERVELTHRAHGREVFARGAARAARWVAGKPPGRYDMADVLGIPR